MESESESLDRTGAGPCGGGEGPEEVEADELERDIGNASSEGDDEIRTSFSLGELHNRSRPGVVVHAPGATRK